MTYQLEDIKKILKELQNQEKFDRKLTDREREVRRSDGQCKCQRGMHGFTPPPKLVEATSNEQEDI